MPTIIKGYHTPVTDALTQQEDDDFEKVAWGLEWLEVYLAGRVGRGFFETTDFVFTPIAGQKAFQVSTGIAIAGIDGQERLVRNANVDTVDAADGVTGGGGAGVGIANYFFLEPTGTWHVDTDNTPTAGSIFRGTGMVDPTEALSAQMDADGVQWARFDGGTRRYRIRTQTGAYALTDEDDLVRANSAGAVTFTLPTAIGRKGREFQIKNVGAGTLTVQPTGGLGQTIDGAANTTQAQWVAKRYYSNGSNWETL
jgi:hypothetical protein